MNSRQFFILSFICMTFVLFAASTSAQNVLVPSSSVSAVTPVASVPDPAPTPALKMTPVPTPTTTSTAKTASNSAASVYIPASQQNMLIQWEQTKIASLQQNIAKMQNAQTTVSTVAAQQKAQGAANVASASSPAAANAAAVAAANVQSSLAANAATAGQSVSSLSAQLLQNQQRLSVLQSGPLKLSDFKTLYQNKAQ